MPWSWFAKRIPRRLRPGLTDAELNAMARSPSYRCPHPRDVLDEEPFTPPGPPAMSAEERALLDAVLADPDDDEHRLRYAEWLEGRQLAPRIATSSGEAKKWQLAERVAYSE